MQNSYTKNYLKIYLWQGVSLVLNFLSMFIVVPYLTSDPVIYGIYTVCISISIFLAYADLGFMSAGQKYASEYFAKGETKEEIKTIGFSLFVLLIFLFLFSSAFLFLSFRPELLIKNLSSEKHVNIASSLLLILALFTPVTLLQRLLQMIFGIRLEDFIVQRTNIVASLLKIISVLWFFRKGQYNIVGYFFFTQIVNLSAAIFALLIARKRYRYDFKFLFKSITFNKIVFARTQNLAFTSLYMTITWILYYELDSIAIGKLLGVHQVAIFAIGLTIMSFFRSLLGILFSPFNVRFNHFIGLNDEDGLKSFFLTITTLMAPIIIIPVIAIGLMAEPLIISWVGIEYNESVLPAQFLIFCHLFTFFTYPTSLLLVAKERTKQMYLLNTILPFVYWIGIGLTYSLIGLKSFAVFKFIAFGISATVYFFILQQYLNFSIFQLIQRYIRPVILPVILLFISSYFIVDRLPYGKSKINLFITCSFTVLMIVSCFSVVYFSSPYIMGQTKKMANFLKL